MLSESIIEVKHLHRTYVSKSGMFNRNKKVNEALKGINFSVGRGEIFGLLGPNGAGKTTTIKILSTLLIPTSGTATILGMDTVADEKRLRSRINFIMGGERCLYWRLSAIDNLKYFSDIYEIPVSVQKKRIPELLELVGLSGKANEKVETFSKGMKQKLQIARGLVNDPDVLFLDEPTIGLDPVSSRAFIDIVQKLKLRGKTIILTTHYMKDAEQLSDRIAILKDGSIIANDTPKALKNQINDLATLEIALYEDISMIQQEFAEDKNIQSFSRIIENDQEILVVQTKDADYSSEFLSDRLKMIRKGALKVREATLEDVYIRLMKGV